MILSPGMKLNKYVIFLIKSRVNFKYSNRTKRKKKSTLHSRHIHLKFKYLSWYKIYITNININSLLDMLLVMSQQALNEGHYEVKCSFFFIEIITVQWTFILSWRNTIETELIFNFIFFLNYIIHFIFHNICLFESFQIHIKMYVE